MFTVNASRKIRGKTTKSSPLSSVKSLKSKIDFVGFEVSTFSTELADLGVESSAVALRVRGVTGALRALVLRAGFALAVETVADLADACI